MVTMSNNKKLNYYLSTWNLSNPQLLTQTMTSQIYTVTHDTETVILKLLSSSETEEQRGAAALRFFDGHGAVRLLRYDEGAHLMEYAAGDELVTLVKRGEDENATRIIAQVIKQLHSVPQDAPLDGLIMLKSLVWGVVQQSCGGQTCGYRLHLCAECSPRPAVAR